jgi:hypothetical protein
MKRFSFSAWSTKTRSQARKRDDHGHGGIARVAGRVFEGTARSNQTVRRSVQFGSVQFGLHK